jgi:hypothetical protein
MREELFMEHDPWRREIESGLNGQHIAIVGYSHYRKETEEDHSGLTNKVMNDVLTSKQKGDSFFSTVPTYFDSNDREDFWRRVHFFNFVPEAFVYGKKYASANKCQIEKARTRFLNTIRELKPDKVFVFSRKAWLAFPEALEERNGHCTALNFDNSDNWGSYDIGCKIVRVCGFRHPLFARGANLRPSVCEFLDMKWPS